MVKRFDCKRNPSLGRWTWLKMVSSALSQRARKQSGKKRSIWMTTKPLEFLKRPNFPNCQKSSGYQLNVIKIKSKKLKMAKRSKKILKRRKTGRYLRESAQISFTSQWQSKVSLLSTDWLAENSWLSSSVQSMKTTASLELSSPTSSTIRKTPSTKSIPNSWDNYLCTTSRASLTIRTDWSTALTQSLTWLTTSSTWSCAVKRSFLTRRTNSSQRFKDTSKVRVLNLRRFLQRNKW